MSVLAQIQPAAPIPDIDLMARVNAVARDLAAQAAVHDADETFVADGYARLKAEGLFKVHVPVEFGGGGADYAQLCAIVRRLGAACGSTALAFAMHSHLVAAAVWRWRNEEGAPTEGLLKRVAAEDLVLVSSGGSDWLKSAGAAVKVDGGFQITAKKMFSSGCLAGDLLMTSAVYEDPEAGPTVLHFAVPFKAPGVSIADTWKVMGMRGTGSHDVELKDVFVADAAISGRRAQGRWHPLFHVISMIAFPIIYSAYLGIAEGARDLAVAAAGKRAADDDAVLAVGEVENALTQARLAVEDMIRNAETSKPGPEATGRAMIGRTLAGDAAIATVTKAMVAAGGASFYRSLGLERAFRDVQAARFHPLQEKPQQRLVGRLALGLDIDG